MKIYLIPNIPIFHYMFMLIMLAAHRAKVPFLLRPLASLGALALCFRRLVMALSNIHYWWNVPLHLSMNQ